MLAFLSQEERHSQLNTETSGDNKDGKNKKENPWITRFLMGPNLTDWLIVMLTAVIAGASILQWNAIQGQLREMQASGKQTDQLISLYRQQAQAAADLAKAAQEANKNAALSDRAWIGIIFNVPPFDPSNPNKPGTIVVSAVNSGRSPALIKRFHIQEYAYEKFPRSPLYVSQPTRASQSIVIPNSQVTGKFPTSTINAVTAEAIKAEKIFLYVYAEVEYTNVRTNTHHVTHNCVYWLRSANEFQSCPEYQYAN